MKRFAKMMAAILCVIMLVPMFTMGYSGYTVENDPVQMPKQSPIIDGMIETDGNWSSPAKMNEATLGHFWAANPLTSTADIYFAYDDDGLYFAADIIDNDEDSGLVPSTGYDNIDDDYGFNGDILTLMLDPLGVFQKSSYQKTPWYHVGIFSDNTVKVFRTNVNDADITDELETAGLITEDGWRFEIFIPWSIIVEDTLDLYSKASVTEAKLAAVNSVSRASCMYMDRYYVSGTAVSTWGRYITVCDTTYDGSTGTHTNGTNAKTYGITLKHAILHKHEWGNWEYIDTPTCTEDGSMLGHCMDPDCNETTTVVAEATGHINTETVVTDPTCTADGSSNVVCKDCETTLSSDLIPSPGHSFGEWTTESAATDSNHGIKRSYCSVCYEVKEYLIPANNAPEAIIDGFTVMLENVSEINHIRYAAGVHTTSNSIRNADTRVDINAKHIAENTVDDVFTRNMPNGGLYSFWIRYNDGTTYIIPVDLSNIEQKLSSDGPVVKVENLYEVSEFFIADGDYDTPEDVEANSVAHITSEAIGTKHSYSYTAEKAGLHTVCFKYTDNKKADLLLKVNVDVTEPEFEVDDLKITISNIKDIKVIRAAYGEYTTSREVKNAATCRNFTASRIGDSESYTVYFDQTGTVTLAVQYSDGYIKIEQFEIEKKVPTFKEVGLSVRFGNLDGLYVIRYAPGNYSTSAEIKRAPGSKYFKPRDIKDGEIVITGLTEGETYSFCVQYDDQSCNYYTITATARLVKDENIIDVGSDRQLLLEDYVIDAEESNTSFLLHSPEKKNNVFTFNAAWETSDAVYHNIVTMPDGTYRMYYKATQSSGGQRRICYIESTDGLTWTRPKLTTYLYSGSASNIVTPPSPDNLFVFYDTNPACPSNERLKGVYGQWGDGLYMESSSNGNNYTLVCPGLINIMGNAAATNGCFYDTLNTIYWNEDLGKYVAFVRGFHQGDNYNLTPDYVAVSATKITRDIRVAFSDDCINWTIPIPINYSDGGDYHMYANAIVPYFRADQVYIGMPTRYMYPLNSSTPGTDIFLMHSRDFVNWERTKDPYFTPDDGREAWDYGESGYPCVGYIQTSDSEMSIYMKERNSSDTPVLYRYTLRLDGFRSAHGDENGNTLVTKYMDITGDSLEVNFKTATNGKIRITMIDEYGNQTASEWLTGDEIAKVLDFGGALDALNGQSVKLSFELFNADLYSFKFN